jgi:hypothetical protein
MAMSPNVSSWGCVPRALSPIQWRSAPLTLEAFARSRWKMCRSVIRRGGSSPETLFHQKHRNIETSKHRHRVPTSVLRQTNVTTNSIRLMGHSVVTGVRCFFCRTLNLIQQGGLLWGVSCSRITTARPCSGRPQLRAAPVFNSKAGIRPNPSPNTRLRVSPAPKLLSNGP